MPNDPLAAFRVRLAQVPDPTLAADLEAALLSRRNERTGHTDWGLLCEEAGLFALAFREFQLALRDHVDDPVATLRLAHHYRERGDSGRATALLERLLQQAPARDDWLTLYADILRQENALPRLRAALQRAVQAGLDPARARTLEQGEAPQDEEPAGEEWTPSDADCMRFLALFAGREDVHARQWVNRAGEGGYSPVLEPLTPAVARNHLLGSYTVGVYPIRLDGTCTFFALDLDISKHALEEARRAPAQARTLRDTLRREAARLLEMLRGLSLAPLFENSGYKGRHYWVFLEQPESAEVLHLLGRLLLSWQAPQVPAGLHLEFFPKQAGRQGKGLGNLIKLPLGIHRRTGHRALLLDDAGNALAAPLTALRSVPRLPRAQLYAAIERLKQLAAAAGPTAAAAPAALAPAAPEPGKTGPPAPAPAPAWTDADFATDPRFKHLLQRCPVLAELKRTADENRQLSHEEQLVLIHTLGHIAGGPQAVNYLFAKCVDVGPEKFLKDTLKGNPVSCPSIRKKIGHITRRLPCNCPFDFAPDRYPTPVLHLLTLEIRLPPPPAAADAETLARRYANCHQRLVEARREHEELQTALFAVLRTLPDRSVSCPGGRYVLIDKDGVEELLWQEEPATKQP